MGNRWVAPDGAPRDDEEDETSARREDVLPASAVDSWRTWLLTGNSGVAGDKKRLRGSHRGLKQMLVDSAGDELPPSWKHFSRAMVRLAINDALNALPREQTHVVWLAYFGGLSNRDIAKRLGISVGVVRRRLKLAFDHVSEYVEHGRTAGQRAVFVLLGWLSLQRLVDSWRHVTEPVSNVVMAGALIATAATAAVIVGSAAIPPALPSTEPAHMATSTAPAAADVQPVRIAASERSLNKTIRATAAKVVPLVPVPTLPPLPLPSPPSLP
ncbi:MAG TPA: sigma-70 family RNA polymerase sigma factor [Candidatus Dormibacteraeota bacterium]|nr:sigma-70 family RNA polymerase sigma factor [Candidatus Dormibacteraeota bacterium]